MTLKKLAIALAAGASMFATGAMAAPSINNAEGSGMSPFNGFDWSSSAAAWTTDFVPVVGSTFTLKYAGWATAVLGLEDLSNLDISANGLKKNVNAYEYTVFASFTEEVVSCGVSSCTFKVLSGSFDVYYDTGANAKANSAAWTGFTDGIKVISGTFYPSSSDQLFNNATGGQADLVGKVNYTNLTYINPALTGTNVTSTLQLGTATTSFSPPSSFQGTSFASVQTGQIVVFQADANQTFTVPEPGALALAGLALAGCGLLSRRRKSA